METILQIKVLKDNINQNDITIKNFLKNIWECDTDLQKLNLLNSEVSKRCNQTREDLADLKRLIASIEDLEIRFSMETHLESMMNQFNFNILALQKAVMSSQRTINSRTRSKLFEYSSQLRNRLTETNNDSKVNKELVANKASLLTDNLYSVSSLLATEVEKSKRNLETLVTSSAVVTETSQEFKTMFNFIANSKTLLSKYGRRELTDKILTMLAFGFFFGCVIYVVGKRIYWR